jgi:RNA polymerase sigma-70 factor (ECF subfamily)
MLIESDEALVKRGQAGDRAAFEELVRRTARIVYSHVYLEVGDGHRAEDLTQETFLTAWRSLHQVTEARGFRSWLFAVAHSTVVDAQRREGRKKRSGPRGDVGELESVVDGNADPSGEAEKNEERGRVLSLLRGLPEEYRVPLTLRYIAGADYETIGRQLAMTNGSLRGLLHRGLEMLRRQLSRKGS